MRRRLIGAHDDAVFNAVFCENFIIVHWNVFMWCIANIALFEYSGIEHLSTVHNSDRLSTIEREREWKS